MSQFVKRKGGSLHLMILIGLVVVSVIPARSWVSAQDGLAPLWVVRALHTGEYGVDEPRGLAFSSEANSFLILDGSANVALVTLGEDHAGSQVISEVQDDPVNVAFDGKSGSLFVFKRGRSELVKSKLDASAPSTRVAVNALGIQDPQGIAFGSQDGRLFILDAGNSQIVSVAPHSTLGFDADEALRSNKVQRISLKKLRAGTFKGIAYNPRNGHLYVSEPAQKKLYELTQSGDLVSVFDLAALGISNPSAMTFAPSVDASDDPNIYDLFILDARAASKQQAASSGSQIVELSLQVAAALPPGTTLLPASLVHIIDTSNAAWNPSAPDPAGVDYWPLTGRLLIADSEVDEMPPYWTGKNVFQSTTSGTLVSSCSTTSYTTEPTGVAINPNNNHIFFSTDAIDRIFEVSLGGDGVYCTADDTFTTTNISNLYNITDAEDVAYGNNTLFIAGGLDAEVYRIPLGANGVLGGGDDGAMTHFDTTALGFADLEAIGYNADAGTLFLASTKGTDRYLGETTTTGTLLRAYDLSLMGSAANLRSDVSYAPGSQNPAVKNIYIVSRGVDNNTNPNENDGKVWEISLGSAPSTATPTRTSTLTVTKIPTQTQPPTATQTPTPVAGPPGAATLISPSGAVTDTTPAYNWNRVNAASWYYLWVSRVNEDGSLSTVHSQWYESSAACSGGTCSVTPAGVTLTSGSYRWWIQTWNDTGYGLWSSAMNFSLEAPGLAALVSPSGIILNPTPAYTWNTASAATWYYLWVSRVNEDGSLTTVHTKWYDASLVCSAGTCSVTPAGVTLTSGSYRWWIQTWNDAGYGPWSTRMDFSLP
jgi:uncharacterized protein YjiK